MRGGTLPALQKLLGHADLKMVLRYSHLAPEYLRQEIEKTERRASAPDSTQRDVGAGYTRKTAVETIASLGAEGGTRTPTPLRAHDPESCASANSATSARRASFIIPSRDGQSSRGRRRPDDFHQPPGAARVRDPRDGRGRARAARDGGQVAA